MNPLFLFAWLFLFPFTMYLGYDFKEINDAVFNYMKKGLVGSMIMIAVGGLVAAWIACGCVPGIIYYGLKIVNPNFYMVTTFIICAIVSSATGTSWGAMATAGIAMFAIGQSMNVPIGMSVGAILSGAYFGDIWSPLSDGANMAAISVESDLMKYCRKEIALAIPTAGIILILYTIMGISFTNTGAYDASLVAEFRSNLSSTFHVGFPAFIPIILLFILLFKRVSALFAMLWSSVAGVVIAVLYQGLAPTQMFKVLWSGYSIQSGIDFIDNLMNRGGMSSMGNNVMMLLFCYGVVGILTQFGYFEALVGSLVSKSKNLVVLNIITMVLTVLGVAFGTGGMALLMTGSLMRPVYESIGYDGVDVAKASNAIKSPINAVFPWNINAIYILGLFGTSVSQYLPYFSFVYVIPIVVIVFSIFKIDVTPLKKVDPTKA